MKLNQKKNSNAFRVVVLVAFMVCFAACGKDEGGTPASVNKVTLDPAVTIKPDSDGAAVLLISGKAGTNWTAEITSGEWISFDRFSSKPLKTASGVVGASLNERERFVYYTANKTSAERTAQITFTFEGEAPRVLDLVQYSVNDKDNIYVTGQARIWPEIPVFKENSHYQYVTHYGKIDGNTARNYTLCFDQSTFTACWVAYPLHTAYTGTGRPEKDPWAYDPKIASSFQANLGKGSYNGGYQRGHQIPNADRSKIMEMQYQTFYCSNATPQNGTLNTKVWATLEKQVRGYMCSDTLYVVTGAYFANRNTTTTDKDGKVCPVPTNYFKVLVRTVKGNIRKKGDLMSDYSDSQLKSIGFWFENKNIYPNAVSSSMVRSVAEIEAQTGFTFFPQISNTVKNQKAPLEWGIN